MNKVLPKGMKVRKEHFIINDKESKICSKCQLMKPLTDYGNFKTTSDGLNYRCRICHNAAKKQYYNDNPKFREHAKKYSKQMYRKIKRRAIEYLGGKCLDCNLEYKPNINESVYDFHHRDPKQKDFAVMELRTRSFNKIKDEIDKCDLLCANCHRLRHQK